MAPTEDEQRSRDVAEAAREVDWKSHSFLRDLFLGSFRLELVHPYPEDVTERATFVTFYRDLEAFLRTRVDPAAIDELGDYPDDLVDELATMGAFGMKIPAAYGGLGFTHREYARAMMLLGSHDANLTALLSAHQSIGVPQPLELFGTEAQKRRYLPLCARSALSGFALTEPAVGSDPARIASTARLTEDGRFYVLNGTKLWCTNGTRADFLVVMARTLPAGDISAFIVDTSWPGVEVAHRCHFMGLRALANGEIVFHDVLVPTDNLLGGEGRGLKLALATLNTGRLALPAATVGAAKRCLEISRKWASVRVQWGRPVGQHEAVSHKLADMAASTFAMESLVDVVSAMADRGYDIRLEAAAAKEWNTVRAWEIVDDTLEIRGGRGYEKERSLQARGEPPIGVERMMRDARVNRIFEGSSEIMHLFMAREAVDKHLHVAGELIDPKKTLRQKLPALVGAVAFYARWFLLLVVPTSLFRSYRAFGGLSRHLRFIERSSRKLARSVFYGMLVYRGGLERKQAFLFRIVDIAIRLFAMATAISRAEHMTRSAHRGAPQARQLASAFCHASERDVRAYFHGLWHNSDSENHRVGQSVLDGVASWLEEGAVALGIDAEDMLPQETQPAAAASPSPPSYHRADTPAHATTH